MILSKRLEAVTSLLPAGKAVADVGCDHGYISICLVESGKYKKAFAMDVRKGPLDIAKDNINKAGLADKIVTRLSDGLAGIEKGDADAAIIAGMGGILMMGILDRSIEKVKAMKYLVLQPQSDIHMVRKYLRTNNINILAENMIKEDGKYYPMFLVSALEEYEDIRGKNALYKKDHMLYFEITDLYGERLIEANNKVLVEYLSHENKVLNSILEKLPESNIERVNEVKHKIMLNEMCSEMCASND